MTRSSCETLVVSESSFAFSLLDFTFGNLRIREQSRSVNADEVEGAKERRHETRERESRFYLCVVLGSLSDEDINLSADL